MKNEHRWKFKVGSGAVDQYRATTETATPSIQVLHGGTWQHWTGEPVAAEVLRLASQVGELEEKVDDWRRKAVQRGAEIADFALKVRELDELADNLEGKGQQARPLSRAEISERIRSILHLPE